MAQTRKFAVSSLTKSFESLVFDNRNLALLPIDESRNNSSRTVRNAIYSLTTPSPVTSPKMVAASYPALNLLGFSPETDIMDPKFIEFFSGNRIHPQSNPAAHCYCGYQFGSFSGQLGDGAAMSLGEILNPATNERWELQLKGAGPTPYSRQSDGRKVLRSSIREFLASEAMHGLGIPTTRAATLITSDSLVARDLFYTGSIVNEKCSVISRIAPNFFRFGSLEIFHRADSQKEEPSGPSSGREDLKRALYDHILSCYFPEIANTSLPLSDKHRLLFAEIFHRTIKLLTLWEGVGFVHGVLNTDNMSVMGLTIDYGPFAFMEGYDPDFTPNGSDHWGRYSWREQREVIRWNLQKLSEALVPLVSREDSEKILSTFDEVYAAERREILNKKLGFLHTMEGDDKLIEEFFSTMEESWTDFTNAFYALTLFVEELHSNSTSAPLCGDALETLIKKTILRLVSSLSAHRPSPLTVSQADVSMPPDAILSALSRKLNILPQRNVSPEELQKIAHLLRIDPQESARRFPGVPLERLQLEIEKEIKAAQLVSKIRSLGQRYQVMADTPETKHAQDAERWEGWVRRYHARLLAEGGVESFMGEGEGQEKGEGRVQRMKGSNPTFVLRNWIAFKATEAAEIGDFSKVNILLEMLQQPYRADYSIFHSQEQQQQHSPQEKDPKAEFIRAPPDWAPSFTCTCSS